MRTAVYDASNLFSLSFMILSLGLLADDRNQSWTLAILTVCVTLGLRASTSIWLAAPGAQYYETYLHSQQRDEAKYRELLMRLRKMLGKQGAE